MSRNYDSWEKLVGAVLRKEKDRQLAYCESFSSYSTDFSFDSDDDFHDLPADIQDLVKRIRFVKCPKCEKILPEPPDYSLYRCGGCGVLLKARGSSTTGIGDMLRSTTTTSDSKAP